MSEEKTGGRFARFNRGNYIVDNPKGVWSGERWNPIVR